MTVTISTDAAQAGWLKVKILGNTTAVANQLGQLENPEGVLLQITDAYLYTVVATAGAATLDIGITATSGADSTNMCSALAINAAAPNVKKIIGSNVASQAALTGGQNGILWPATSYLSVYGPAAVATTLLEAYLFIEYVRLA
jgi:hypothetical protein